MIWENRSWLPFVFLIGVIIIALIILLSGYIFPNNYQSPIEPSSGCVVMKDRGDYDNSIDIVFLGDNYKSVEDFVKDTEDFASSLLSVYPYSDYVDRFNFFRIENFLYLGCSYDGGVILCSPSNVKIEGRICPHDYYVVLSDVDGVKNLFQFLRSSSWMGVNALNTADNKLVFAHEFGHSFGDFADEYEWDGGEITWDAPNCDSDWRNCNKFKDIEDSECWRGCVNQQYSRSIKIGIMRDYWNSNVYGSYNEYFLKGLLETKTSKNNNKDSLKSPPVDVFLVYVSCNSIGCSIIDVEQDKGYADSYVDDSFLDVSNGNNKASLVNPKLFSDFGNSGSVSMPDNFDSVIVIEKDSINDKIDLIDNGGKIIDSYKYSNNQDSQNKIFGPSKKIALT